VKELLTGAAGFIGSHVPVDRDGVVEVISETSCSPMGATADIRMPRTNRAAEGPLLVNPLQRVRAAQIRRLSFLLLLGALTLSVACARSAWPTAPLTPAALAPTEVPPLGLAMPLRGLYQQHVQGLDVYGNFVYWSLNDSLLKTDLDGRIQVQVPVKSHHGDLCVSDGRLLVAVNFTEFDNPSGGADSWLYVYSLDGLTLLQSLPIPEVRFGAGGVGCGDGRIIVVGGLPAGQTHNVIYEYTTGLRLISERKLEGGYSVQGIQTATFGDSHWWFGAYGGALFKVSRNFSTVSRFSFDASFGISAAASGLYYVLPSRSPTASGLWGNQVARLAKPDPTNGLRIMDGG
jgi:hypothetical protein